MRAVDETTHAARLAEALAAAMYYRRRTTADVAAGVGVTAETVRRWLRADTTMSLELATRVADYLVVPLDFLARPPADREQALLQLATLEGMRRAGR